MIWYAIVEVEVRARAIFGARRKLRAYALSAIRYLSHENSTHVLISFHLASSSSREIISSRARSISFHLVESRALRIAIQIAIASNREIADSSRFHLARSRFISRDQRHLVISRDHLVLSRLSFSVTHTLSPKDNLVGDARSFLSYSIQSFKVLAMTLHGGGRNRAMKAVAASTNFRHK